MGAGPTLKGDLEGETDAGLVETEGDIPSSGTAYTKSGGLSQICFPSSQEWGVGPYKGRYHLKSETRRAPYI